MNRISTHKTLCKLVKIKKEKGTNNIFNGIIGIITVLMGKVVSTSNFPNNYEMVDGGLSLSDTELPPWNKARKVSMSPDKSTLIACMNDINTGTGAAP